MDPKDLKFYEENGYLIVPKAVQGTDLERLTQELALMQSQVESGYLRGNHLMEESGVARVIFNPYDHSPTLRQIGGRDDMVDRARAMLKTSVQLHHSKIMCKVAGTGTDQPPHQDYFYWKGKKDNQVAVFICIDPSTEENGCLRLCPGTQKLGLLPHEKHLHPVTGERHWLCEVSDEMRATEVKFIAEPGDAVYFHSLTVHYSEGNKSNRPRRGVIYEYDEKDNMGNMMCGWGAPAPDVFWD